ncbi:MAG: hypothetical protein JWQ90_632 [Hydrocarboniphaga sp.]|uniref:Calx-beta domain-containing protein n=1 Tax=Hydrocarboniphaga sp. TaxID=2033016 RepID=UPI002609C3C0|nr:Calx-beta domain-containing protein [Hydrocarboniphaga sp.]MDB5968182.1 hypothetical protein [Hydrocarboniphaga sp.]
MAVKVKRSGATACTASAQYTTNNGTAIAGSDYTSTSGGLTWASGENGTKTFNVPILQDTVYESTESFRVDLSNINGSDGGSYTSAQVNISDDDPADTTPNAFSFTAVTNAAPSTVYASNAIIVSGLESGYNDTAISVSSGTYSLNGAAYIGAAGTVKNGDTVTVQTTSSASYETTVKAKLTIGTATGTFAVTTRTADTTPDTFSFTAVTGAAPSTVYTSNSISVSGLESGYTGTAMSVSGGMYSLNGAAFTAAAGTVKNGDAVRVQGTSSASYDTKITAKLKIGTASGTFAVTTSAADTTPNAYSFAAVTGATPSTVYTSNSITVGGLSPGYTATKLSISGGKYSLNGAAYTNAAGTVKNGDTVTVQATSSASYSTKVTAKLKIGTASGTFAITTRAADTTPDAFSFAPVTGATPSTVYTSNTVTIGGLEPGYAGTAISVSSGQYSLNGAAYTSVAGTVKNGDTVKLQTTSSASYNTKVTATLVVGTSSALFDVTTAQAPGTPLGSAFLVNTYMSVTEASAVASDSAGNFVVTWMSKGQDSSGWGIYAQRYDADGSPQGSEFRVSEFRGKPFTSIDQYSSPAIAGDAAGHLVVTWTSYDQDEDGSGWGIYAQRYAADGSPQGSEFRVSTYTSGDQYAPAVASDSAGHFVVAWMSNGQDNSGWGIYAQRYTADGSPSGSEFRVNTYTSGGQYAPAVAGDSAGHFVVTWVSSEQGDSGQGICAQRYAGP